MQVRIKEKKVYVPRKAYEQVKRLDHKGMERFLQGIYEIGVEDGKPDIPEETLVKKGMSIASDAAVRTLTETKGIGEKRKEAAVCLFREHLKAGYERWMDRRKEEGCVECEDCDDGSGTGGDSDAVRV